ncbi:MAG TPA: phosphoglycerate dehydrogenase [Anaerolineae bacterium]|nr:phosphoglycerate dehydrogenase [Anaerolineae bacterium]
MPKVLLSAPYMLPYKERFTPIFTHYGIELIIPEVHERLSEKEILAYAGDFDGTICGDDHYTKEVLIKCAPRLKIISKWGTGIDSIDQQTAAELRIQVRNTPNAFTFPVADSVLGYILAFARCQPGMDRLVKAGKWEKLPGRSLSECTLGVIGVGNVGKAVLRRAHAFEMKLLGNDILSIAPDFILECGVEMTTLKDLLERSDFVSVNCDLNPTSYHLINTKTLSWARHGAVLINTARGPIVDEIALVEALNNGGISGAALDVFEVEPLTQDSPLLQMKNVMLGSHNSNSSPKAWEHVHWNTIRNLLEGLQIQHSDYEAMKLKFV